MNELQKALDSIFTALDAIPVSGAGVELMATARAGLRAAYRMAEAEPSPQAEAADAEEAAT